MVQDGAHSERRDPATPTLALGSSSTAQVQRSAVVPPTDTALASVESALNREELGRLAVFARLIALLCVAGLAGVPLYGGDPLARAWVVAALLVAMAASGFLYWMTLHPERYRHGALFAATQIQEVCATVAAFFFGAFSPFAAVVSLAIYVYSLGASWRSALAAYLNLALGQLILAALIMSGAIYDRGLIRADSLELSGQLMVQANIQFIYLVSFVLARLSRRKTLAAVADHADAVRAVAQREALFQEARQELERAAGLGRTGRFSDQRLGAYMLGPVIGRGAMGEIYRAEHVQSGAAVAVKLLQRSVLYDPTLLMRFSREAKLAASLDTPHVVRILEIGDAPVPFIAMELLEGDDLARRLRDQPVMMLADAVELVRQAAHGLAAAHARGIVHRDVKPQNLFRSVIGTRVVWKLLDFGISKLQGDEAELTGAQIVGTPAYMPPEQAVGADVDARADLYALTAVAYRAVTGHPMFAARDPAALLHAVAHKMPRQPSDIATLPADLDAFFAIGLAKRPGDRFATAAALASAFEAATQNRLDPALRAKAEAISARTPWKRSRSATAPRRANGRSTDVLRS